MGSYWSPVQHMVKEPTPITNALVILGMANNSDLWGTTGDQFLITVAELDVGSWVIDPAKPWNAECCVFQFISSDQQWPTPSRQIILFNSKLPTELDGATGSSSKWKNSDHARRRMTVSYIVPSLTGIQAATLTGLQSVQAATLTGLQSVQAATLTGLQSVNAATLTGSSLCAATLTGLCAGCNAHRTIL